MSKRNQYDRDDLTDKSEVGYYYPPMYRDSEEDDMRQQTIAKRPMADSEMDMNIKGMEPGFAGIRPTDVEGLPVSPIGSQMQPTIQDIGFTQAFLRTVVGKRVRVEFLLGTSIMVDKSGILEEVGISYIVLAEESGTRVMCDLYSIKFVNIFR